MAVIEANMYTLAIIGLLATVISAFYYLRVIKIIYFDKPKKSFDISSDLSIKIPIIISTLIILMYFIYPSLLINTVNSIIVY